MAGWTTTVTFGISIHTTLPFFSLSAKILFVVFSFIAWVCWRVALVLLKHSLEELSGCIPT